ncbi:MAG: hypothetical protein EOP07_18935, partial [Proteobacteria bacterium]
MLVFSRNIFLCLILLGSALTDASAQQKRGLDINDVAVLFPLDSSAQALPKILLSEPKLDLIPKTIYTDVWKASKASGIAAPFLS